MKNVFLIRCIWKALRRLGATKLSYRPYRRLVARLRRGDRNFVLQISFKRTYGDESLVVMRGFFMSPLYGRERFPVYRIWFDPDPTDMRPLENFIKELVESVK